MKTMLSCDQVFDVLTQGPFPQFPAAKPSAAEPPQVQQSVRDEEVELHLSVCHSCRQLAEALRPATTALGKASLGIAAETLAQRDSLPQYRGRLPQLATSEPLATTIDEILRREEEERAQIAEAKDQLARLERNQLRQTRRQASRRATQIAAIAVSTAIVSLSAAVMMWIGLSMESQPSTMAAIPSITRPAITPSANSLVHLVALHLPEDCRHPADSTLALASPPLASPARADRSGLATNTSFECCTRCHRSTSEVQLDSRALAVIAHSCLHCHES